MAARAKATNSNGKPATGELRTAVLSELRDALTRTGFAAQHGLQYAGARDLYKVGGYPRTLKFKDYESLYDRDGIAGQIVDLAPETTWRHPPEVRERRPEGADAKEATEFEKQWTALVDRLGLWQRFERADRLSRIGQYGVILIGATGSKDDAALSRPLTKVNRPEDIVFLSCYNEKQAKVKTWVTANEARFGLPETYEIDRSSGVENFRPNGQTRGSTVVHHTRILHIAEGLSDDEVYGRPALQRVYNDLFDLQKVSASTGEGFWQRVAGILTASIDPQVENADELIPGLKEEMEAIFHDLRRGFVGQGVELSRLAESEPNPKAAADLYMARIAAGSGYPKRILFGSETGERASSEDQKTFLGSIGERQKQHAEPQFVRAFLERLMLLGALKRPALGYDVVWPPLFEESELEVAQANYYRAQTIDKLTPVGGDKLLITEIDEERNVWPVPRKPEDPSPFADLEPVEPTGPRAAEDDEEPAAA